MKLYTEEQVMKAYNMGIDDGHNGAISLQINELSLTPIELPSDEEIENIMISKYPHSVGVGVNHLIKSDERIGFEAGAKWVKEQIPNQNKQTNNMVVCIRDLNTSKNINTEERKQVPRKDECIVINKLYYKVFSVTWHYDDLLVIVDVVPFSSNQNK